MMVDRRVFVAGAALAAVTPALRLLPSEAAVPETGAIEQPALHDQRLERAKTAASIIRYG